MEIILATKNPHKIEEIKSILGEKFILHTIENLPLVKESGRTLFENSLLKAEFIFKLTGKPSLADDSGLFVDGLNGAPGIYSSRYGRNDKKRIERVLKELKGNKNRKACFKAVFVYYYAPDKYEAFEGECEGMIADKPRGNAGFGYDPIFIPEGYKKTFAELGPEIKNRISHRAKALKKLKRYLLRYGSISKE